MLQIEKVFYEGKNVGEIINNIMYISRRRQSKHLFKGGHKTVKQAIKDKTAYWGVSNEILEQLKFKDIKIVCIKDEDTNTIYWTTLNKITQGKVMQLQNDMQKFVELSEWHVTNSFDRLLQATLEVVK